MAKAVIVGGTGQIGLALARDLVRDGWSVTIASRSASDIPPGCRHATADARDVAALRAGIGEECDLLVSCVAFDAADAAALADAGRDARHIVAISSISVYRDADGRTLDEAARCGFPDFVNPLTEDSPTIAPGDTSYSTRKIAMERALFDQAACPVTILRPGAIHGPDSKGAREWWFVKRLLDRRATIPLAYGGRSRFQTTSVAAIVDAVRRAAAGDLAAIANVSDADCPSVAEIGQTIMEIMGMKAELIGLADSISYPPALGRNPWSLPRPMICSALATAPTTYRQSVGPAIDWLIRNVDNDNWRERLPHLAAYPGSLFDYDADDRAARLPDAVAIAG